AQQGEAAAARGRGIDGVTPVGLDAELLRLDLEALPGRDEGLRNVLERSRLRAELRERLRLRQAADGDARDPDSGREPVPRAGEGETEDERRDDQHACGCDEAQMARANRCLATTARSCCFTRAQGRPMLARD